ncbi:MAG: hypothetical protein J7513_05850 [Solirubrobacteraceae bacterium]|nr:hypothetical protein [Solirubrobacteraceae bacterium]
MSRKHAGLHELFRLAASTGRCVNARALKGAGFDDDRIGTLLEQGAMNRAAPGVYVVGADALTREHVRWVGTLLGKPGSVIGARTSAEHAGLLKVTEHEIDVNVPDSRRTRIVCTLLNVDHTGRPATIRLRGSIRVPTVSTIGSNPHARRAERCWSFRRSCGNLQHPRAHRAGGCWSFAGGAVV